LTAYYFQTSEVNISPIFCCRKYLYNYMS